MSDASGSSSPGTKLSPEARTEWLRNHDQNPEDWTDDDILLAIGSGFA